MPQRLAEALVGKPEKKAAATLARPCAMNSWLLSRRCPDLSAMAWAIESACVSDTSATATAPGRRFCSVAAEASGNESGGSAPGSGPSVRRPVRSAPRVWLARKAIRLLLFFQAEDGIRYLYVTGVQTCALPI